MLPGGRPVRLYSLRQATVAPPLFELSANFLRLAPNFQRFLSAKAEHIREAGRDVNIWRYADEPVAPTSQ